MHGAANVAASRPTSAENVFNPEKGDEKQYQSVRSEDVQEPASPRTELRELTPGKSGNRTRVRLPRNVFGSNRHLFLQGYDTLTWEGRIRR